MEPITVPAGHRLNLFVRLALVASGLADGGDEDRTVLSEYERGLIELIIDSSGLDLTFDDRETVARIIGVSI